MSHDDGYDLWLANQEADKAYDREQGWQRCYDGMVTECAKLQEELSLALKILDPENRFESLEDAAKARMQQIVALEALR